MSQPSDTVNSHILEYLQYYCSLIEAPEYAVLVKGEWGSGKTFLVRHFLNSEVGHRGWLYVSLYGITDLGQIDDEIFSQLHPVLASKAAKNSGKFLKALIRGTLRIDFDDDGGAATAAPNLEELNPREFIPTSENRRIFVFDDLERCESIQLFDVLGYINSLVEHSGCKVIVIGNEEELKIKLQEEDCKRYKKEREKIFGKTLRIEPDYKSGIKYFSGSIVDASTRTFLNRNSDLIEEVFISSGYNNMRYVRQILLHFERVYSRLDQKYRDSEPAMKELLRSFLCFGMEVRAGQIQAGEIKAIWPQFLASDSEKSRYKELRQKYQRMNFYRPVLGFQIWEALLDRGEVPCEKIRKALATSDYFPNDQKPDWERLWSSWSLEDSEFERLTKSVTEQLSLVTVQSDSEALHIAAMLLSFEKIGVYSLMSRDEIVSNAKFNLDRIYEGGWRQKCAVDSPILSSRGFIGEEDEVFKGLLAYAKAKLLSEREINYPVIAEELFDLAELDAGQFLEKVCLHPSGASEYWNIPIFASTSPVRLAEIILNARSEDRDTIHAYPHSSGAISRDFVTLTRRPA